MSSSPSDSAGATIVPVSRAGRFTILAFAFLGWAFAGVHMSINGIVSRVAPVDLLEPAFVTQGISENSPAGSAADASLVDEFDADGDQALNNGERARAREAVLSQWFGYLTCAFLLGAAAGGYLFGFAGDRIGRAKAMAASILCYSIFSGLTYFVTDPTQLLGVRFLTCLGIGGMWPNGIALLSEAWPNISRPFLAGAIGTAANVGILCFALVTVLHRPATAADWRWVFVVGASPVLLGILSLLIVPESPRWLALNRGGSPGVDTAEKPGMGEIFRSPLRKLTIFGILLGAVPLFGGWGVANWATAWASEKGDVASSEEKRDNQDPEDGDKPEKKKDDPVLKSMVVVARSLPGSLTSLLGGALAFWLGRKRSYFLVALGALVCTQFLFRVEDPNTSETLFTVSLMGSDLNITVFLAWNAGLGFFSGFFFGWLPLCLPELFPTRVRSTGAGVSFNWGRILTAIGVLGTAWILKEALAGQYQIAGRYAGLVYAIGMIVIWFAPISEDRDLDD